MAMDENNLGGEAGKEQEAPTPVPSTPPPAPEAPPAPAPTPTPPPAPPADPVGAPSGASASELADRKNAAKAFYRAMYAGGEPEPEDFGMNTRGGGAVQSGPCGNCARLEAENKELEKAKNESDNYYKRVVADFENYRRRTDREREESVALGVQKALEAILPALDDLERAKQMLTLVTDPKAVTDSLNLVFGRFAKCMESQGVKPMDVIGTPFDPKFHEPVQEVETNEFADGAVMQELRRGYIMKDKVIRPSLVNVASNPSGIIVAKAAPAAEAPPVVEAVVVEAPVSAPAASVSTEPVAVPSPEAAAAPVEVPPVAEAAPAVVSAEPAKSAAESLMESLASDVSKDSEKPARLPEEREYDPSATADVPVYNPDMYESLHADSDLQQLAVNAPGVDDEPAFEMTSEDAQKKSGELAESSSTQKKVVDE